MDLDRTLAPSPFPRDSGEASAETRERLAAAQSDGGTEAYLSAVVALCGDRVIVPVVATATRMAEGADGLTADKEAEMAVVGIRDQAGRHAMLIFSGLDALQAWDARARPVPTTLDVAARAALADGAAALVVDVAGPYPLVIEGEVLAGLGRGHRLVAIGAEFGWAMPSDTAPAD